VEEVYGGIHIFICGKYSVFFLPSSKYLSDNFGLLEQIAIRTALYLGYGHCFAFFGQCMLSSTALDQLTGGRLCGIQHDLGARASLLSLYFILHHADHWAMELRKMVFGDNNSLAGGAFA
jgi:hypothetical protein